MCFLALALVSQIVIALIVSNIFPEAYGHLGAELDNRKLFARFINLVFFGPLLETLIFQWLIIELIFIFRPWKVLAVMVSASIFAFAHGYGIFHILSVFPMGLVFSTYYLILRKEGKLLAYLSVCCVHACINLFAFIINYN